MSDMRALPTMAALGHPVILDATHSVQQPGGLELARAASEFVPFWLGRQKLLVCKVFSWSRMKTGSAPSDGPNMVPLSEMPVLLDMLCGLIRQGGVNAW